MCSAMPLRIALIGSTVSPCLSLCGRSRLRSRGGRRCRWRFLGRRLRPGAGGCRGLAGLDVAEDVLLRHAAATAGALDARRRRRRARPRSARRPGRRTSLSRPLSSSAVGAAGGAGGSAGGSGAASCRLGLGGGASAAFAAAGLRPRRRKPPRLPERPPGSAARAAPRRRPRRPRGRYARASSRPRPSRPPGRGSAGGRRSPGSAPPCRPCPSRSRAATRRRRSPRPRDLSHFVIVPSETETPIWGMTTSTAVPVVAISPSTPRAPSALRPRPRPAG